MNIRPWQQDLIDKMTKFKGRGLIQTTGRQSGKSQMQAYMRLWNDIHYQPISDLKLSEGTVYGSRYHCVEPVGGNWIDMEVWCMDTFGGPGDKIWGDNNAPEPQRRWYMNARKFWFLNEADRTLFILKWR